MRYGAGHRGAVDAAAKLKTCLDVAGPAGVRGRPRAHRGARGRWIRGEMSAVTRRARRRRGAHAREQCAAVDTRDELAARVLVTTAARDRLLPRRGGRVGPACGPHAVASMAGHARWHVGIAPTQGEAVGAAPGVGGGALVTRSTRGRRAGGGRVLGSAVTAPAAERPVHAGGKLLAGHVGAAFHRMLTRRWRDRPEHHEHHGDESSPRADGARALRRRRLRQNQRRTPTTTPRSRTLSPRARAKVALSPNRLVHDTPT